LGQFNGSRFKTLSLIVKRLSETLVAIAKLPNVLRDARSISSRFFKLRGPIHALSGQRSRFVQAQPSPPQWFDKDSLFTAAGSTTAVIVVTSVLQRISPKFPARWFALGLSLALSLLSISVHQQAWTAVNILIALINGLMTYTAAVGINTVVTIPTLAVAPPVAQRSYRWWP
jgi:hypothetical protein